MKDPFNTDRLLGIDFDTSYEESESWQGALKNEENTEQIASERTASTGVLRFFTGAIIAVMVLLLGRLAILQVAGFDQNKALAEGNRIRETEVRAPRGVVYDAKRGLVARNTPNFEVTIVPSELPKKSEDRGTVYSKLAETLKKQPAEVAATAEAKGLRYSQPIVIADKLDRDTSVLLTTRQTDLPGVQVTNNPQRQYDKPDLYAHLLGYTGRVSEEDLKRDDRLVASDYVGKSGLESVYETELRGAAGKRRVEVNASGQAEKELAASDPVSGKNLVLSVDSDLQTVMSAAVDKGIRSSKKAATGGSAVALNPKTGEVLGLVSLPSFDNNKFVNGIATDDYARLRDDKRKPLFNRPVSGEYPPGSTFKLVTATAALGEGVVEPNTWLPSPPELTILGYKFPDWNPSGHGTVNATRALAVSSDVYFYKVSGGFGELKGVGEDKLGDYMRQFGIGTPSGIDLPDERTGLVPTRQYKEDTFNEDWFIGNTYQMGIGQGYVLTTPLQVAQYTAAVANKGIAYKPHLVKAVENADNPADNKTVTPEPIVRLKVDQSVLEVVQEGMRQAVETGTARELASVPIDICGKTGSAEFANETNAHAWFTAFAPCDDPQIVLTVMIEGGGEGSDVAVPAAKTIFESFFKVPAAPASPTARPAIGER